MASIDIYCMLAGVNVSLTKHWEQFVAAKLKSGLYYNASEIIRAGLKLLQTEDELIFRARKLTIELEAALAAARQLPKPAPVKKTPTIQPAPGRKRR